MGKENLEGKTLQEKIRYYATKYYEGEPEISDAEFDKLTDQLEKEFPNDPLLKTVGWGYVVNAPADQEGKHRFEILKFEDKIREVSKLGLKPHDCIVSAKIDGGSVCCYYVDGKLDQALTRGDGITGFDITKKMKHIVPETLKDSSFTGMVRGEIAMTNYVFQEKYASEYESARNLAIGMIKRSKISLDELKDLSFVAYTVRGRSHQKIASKDLVLSWLADNEFEVVDVFELSNSEWTDEGFRNIILNYKTYAIDGIIITTKEYQGMADLTFVPVKEVAYKTASETVEVTVKDIEWNLTRTGKMFPKIVFDSVRISGANVERATAFNAKYVKDNGLGIGSKVSVMRSGEVIPDIQEVLTREPYELPSKCPKCGSALEMDGFHLVCRNTECEGAEYNTMLHWISILAPIKSIGSSILDTITSTLKIYSVPDMYAKIEEIPSVYKEGSATKEKVEEMVKKLTSPVKFNDFLRACNIPMVGNSASDDFSSYQDMILEGTVDSKWKADIQKIVGPNKTAKENLIKNIEKIRKLSKFVTFVKIEKPAKVSKVMSDGKPKIVAITGKLSVPRNDFINEISKYGWTVGTVTKKTQYLVTDTPDSGSSKNVKAQKMGVKVISEMDFRKIIRL